MGRRLIALAAGGAAVTAIVVTAFSQPHQSTLQVNQPLPPPNRDYAVAAPGDPALRGTVGLQQLPCRVRAIRTSATTSRAADGVVGLVSIRGRGCGLDIGQVRLRLLGADGGPLLVAGSAGNPVNAAFSVRPDIAEGAGSVRVGFAWTGSYCGPPPSAVEIELYGQPFPIPLRGPVPNCLPGLTSTLIPGVIDGPGLPAEPAPVAWESLRARVVLPETVPKGPVPVTVVLANQGRRDVSLAAPCPTYRVTLAYVLDSIAASSDEDGDFCSRPLTVKAGHSLSLALGGLFYPALTQGRTGDRITLSWTMAGVPVATATATIG